MTGHQHPAIARFLDLCAEITAQITHLPTERDKQAATLFLTMLLQDLVSSRGDDAMFEEMLKKRLAEKRGQIS